MRGIFNIIFYAVFWVAFVVLTAGVGLILAVPLFWFTFSGADARAEKVEQTLIGTLMKEETLLAFGLQHRAFAFRGRRALLAITSSRVLVLQRGLLGGFKMKDIQWKDLRDVTISQNVLSDFCGSNLSFAHYNANVGKLAVLGIERETASEIYSRAQSEEQAWEEKRRVRAIEEVRAAAGGVTVHAGAPSAVVAGGNRMLEEITKAKELLDVGAISDAEFQEMKSKILGAA